MRRGAILRMLACATAAGSAAVPVSAAAQEPPVASFTYAPSGPLTLESVELRSTSSGEITATKWDLDDDGECDDAQGPTASRAFAVPATYRVKMCVAGPGGEATQVRPVVVANRPPQPSFATTSAVPDTGDPVVFVATATDPDGTIATYAWDLDGDGEFDDASGVTASRAYPDPGVYLVSLRVTDDIGAQASSTQTFGVAARVMAPTPAVRLVGGITERGMSVRRLVVRAPAGALVDVRCRGRGCSRRRELRPVAPAPGRPSASLRFGRFERRLRAGAVLEVRVTQRGAIGKHTSFRIRAGVPPRRTDRCLTPGRDAPVAC